MLNIVALKINLQGTSLKEILFNLLRKRGYVIRPEQQMPYGYSLVSDLKKLGWSKASSKLIFDVGANVGEFTHELRSEFPLLQSHCFEPDPRSYATLLKRFETQEEITCNNVGCGARNETAVLHQNQNTTISSIVPSELQLNSTTNKIDIQIVTLEDYSRELGAENIDLVKIDVEGFEVEVLQGAMEIMPSIGAFVLEVRFGDYKISGTRFEVVNEFMLSNGFHFCSLYNFTSTNKTHFDYGDVLFLNESIYGVD